MDALRVQLEGIGNNQAQIAKSVTDLANELKLFIHAQPVHARFSEQVKTAVATVTLCVFVAGGFTWWFNAEFARASESFRSELSLFKATATANATAMDQRMGRLESHIAWQPSWKPRTGGD
jgi:hypothetical protein